MTINIAMGINKFHDPLPRKGTETLALGSIEQLLLQVSDPLPRKGTETKNWSLVKIVMRVGFRSITPQGDGNGS